MEQRSHAREQAARLQAVRGRAAGAAQLAQRAQRSAAALRRSVGVSQRVAALQARALLDAAGVMQVRARAPV